MVTLVDAKPPAMVVLAGPNGAGKTTAAPALLRDTLSVTEFVNADVIAQGLSGFAPANSGLAAGRVMLDRIRWLAAERVDFAFETTLASRTFAPWIRRLLGQGYESHFVFLWLPTAQMAVARVRARVRLGGHDIPEDTIRRRYRRGIRNFLETYRALAGTWRVYDNARPPGPTLIARGGVERPTEILDEPAWAAFETPT